MSIEFKSPFTPCVPVAADTLVTPEVWSTDKNANARYLLGMGGASYPQRNTIYVDPVKGFDTGKYAGLRETTLPFRSITAALSAAQNKDTIEILGADIHVIASPLSITQDGLRIVSRNGAMLKTASSATARIFVLAGNSDVQFEGLQFDCAYTNVDVGTALDVGIIDATGTQNLTVKNCIFQNSRGKAIYVKGAATNTKVINCNLIDCGEGIWAQDIDSGHRWSGFRVSGCTIKNTYAQSLGGRGIALHNNNVATAQSKRIIISDNDIDNYPFGIELQGATGNRNGLIALTNNIISTGSYGISLSNCERVAVSGGSVYDQSFIGIEFSGCNYCSVTGSIVDEMGEAGVCISVNSSSSKIVITGPVLNNGYRGVHTISSSEVRIVGGEIDNMSNCGIYFQETSHASVIGCAITMANTAAIAVDVGSLSNVTGFLFAANPFTGTTDSSIIKILAGAGGKSTTDIAITGNKSTGVVASAGHFQVVSTGGTVTYRLAGNISDGQGSTGFVNTEKGALLQSFDFPSAKIDTETASAYSNSDGLISLNYSNRTLYGAWGNDTSIEAPYFAVAGIRVLSAQQPAIANSTATAGSVSTQLNLLLAALRVHGIIAT